MFNIPQMRLDRAFELHQEEYESAALRVLRSGWYIFGNEIEAFEGEFAAYIGSKHCIGVGNGLDALCMSVRALGIGKGDEVIVPANTFIASVMSITMNGNDATPVFVEPDEYHNIDPNKIESAITPRTKAILPVHLYGQTCDMSAIMSIADRYDLRVIEDCAQSHGAKHNGRTSGTFGDVGCFSFYPSKNLGAFGDAGAVVTDSDDIADKLRIYRNYGSEKRYHNMVVGVNSRLGEMQSALLRVRLKYLDQNTQMRRDICEYYQNNITNPLILLPKIRKDCECVWHQFVVMINDRSLFIDYLKEHGIGTIIHYPIPPHLQDCYRNLGYKQGDFPIAEQYADHVLSLPVYSGMTAQEQEYIVEVINKWQR
ncbi:MAG: DegT/DnrJ/EryC1/StrS family aminotransferase [Oscillospiraceae bacterium]|nr:DegT/DnrJ/EryC1/StrS family aminotransferase [Oscillospiraceae bacterium]